MKILSLFDVKHVALFYMLFFFQKSLLEDNCRQWSLFGHGHWRIIVDM